MSVLHRKWLLGEDGCKEIYQVEVALEQQAPKMQAFQVSLTEDVQCFIVDLISGTRLTDLHKM